MTVCWYFCRKEDDREDLICRILVTIISQLLRAYNSFTDPYIFQKYVSQSSKPNLTQLRSLLLDTLQIVPGRIRIILDGINNCSEESQQSILNEFSNMCLYQPHGTHYKVLFSSREKPLIAKILAGRPQVSLSEQSAASNSRDQVETATTISRDSGYGSMLSNRLATEPFKRIQSSPAGLKIEAHRIERKRKS
jgi:hypothetical protein